MLEIVYFDENGDPTSEEKASTATITTYDEGTGLFLRSIRVSMNDKIQS